MGRSLLRTRVNNLVSRYRTPNHKCGRARPHPGQTVSCEYRMHFRATAQTANLQETISQQNPDTILFPLLNHH